MSGESKMVYPEQNKDGIIFSLFSDGRVMARIKETEPEEVSRLTFKDTGQPWIPAHKNVSKIFKMLIRDGDVDHLIKRRADLSAQKGFKRKAAEEMFAALEKVHSYQGEHIPEWLEEEVSKALAKARGEEP